MNARFSFSEQELGHKIWTIVELFYRSHLVFKEQFENYEKRVLDYSRITGIRRQDLRLKPAELASLLDLKSLERMRDGYLYELKDLCHLVFRGQDRTDLLDRYVSDIFHEISILKEEHYNVKTYAPLYERDSAEIELKHILDEAHTIFPQELSHILYLFGRAQARLEEHLASFRKIQLFIRSLYLQRNDFVREAYPEGLERFYSFMYGLGPLEGYYEVGLSFYHSGFKREALEAFRLAAAAYRRGLAAGDAGDEKTAILRRRKVHEILRLGGLRSSRLEEGVRLEDEAARTGDIKVFAMAGAGSAVSSGMSSGMSKPRGHRDLAAPRAGG